MLKNTTVYVNRQDEHEQFMDAKNPHREKLRGTSTGSPKPNPLSKVNIQGFKSYTSTNTMIRCSIPSICIFVRGPPSTLCVTSLGMTSAKNHLGPEQRIIQLSLVWTQQWIWFTPLKIFTPSCKVG